MSSDGLNEDIMTKHLLKLNEIENQFRELTNKFEEVRRCERIRATSTRSKEPVVSRQPIGVGCPRSRIVASSKVSG